MNYEEFLKSKTFIRSELGINVPLSKISKKLFPWQRLITRWALAKGRAALFEDCGAGKSAQMSQWADNIPGRTISYCPLSVAPQLVREFGKFGVESVYSRFPVADAKHTITNYELMHRFNPDDYEAVILDEASIIKSFEGKFRNEIIARHRHTPYRLEASATPAPNDWMELGNHSEFLGNLTRTEMLATFFVHDGGDTSKWRLKGHAQKDFWRWICSFAVMLRRPSDLGFSDEGFILPELRMHEIVVDTNEPTAEQLFELGSLFPIPAKTLMERRQARSATVEDRAKMVADIVATKPDEQWIIWTNLNKESELVSRLIPDAVEVTGSDTPEFKESSALAFADGKLRVLVSKSLIFGYGMNFQSCHNEVFLGLSDCYDEQTEVLTDHGWSNFGNVQLDSKIATVNQSTLELEWQNPSRIVWEKYNGPMVHFHGQRNFDLLVTPNHKMFVDRCKTRYLSDASTWHFEYAGDIKKNYRRQEFRMLSCPSSYLGEVSPFIDIPLVKGRRTNSRSRIVRSIRNHTFMQLVGWYLTEGYCRPLSSKEAGRIVICQTDVNPDNRKEIIGMMESLDLSVNSKTKDITSYSFNLAHFLTSQFGEGSRNKFIPGWVKNLDSSLLIILRDTMLKGDGCHKFKGCERASFYRTISQKLADDFQEICLKTGIRASVHKRYDASKYGDGYCYDVCLAWDNTRPAIHTEPELVDYDGMIGCVTVPNHTVIVRRNGIPCVSGNSWESYYQAVRRVWRFGQKHPVDCYIVTSSLEGEVVKNIKRKEVEAAKMAEEMVANMSEFNKAELKSQRRKGDEYKTQWETGRDWNMHLGDTCEVIKEWPENSVHYVMSSLPFASLYTYSASERDAGNCRTHAEFWQHMDFLIPEIYRVVKPGRLVSMHCMNLPKSKERDGVIGITDFRGDVIRAFEKAGFIYHSEVCIWKDPVTAMQRTKALGLLHKQIKKDSCMSRQGIPDYLVTMRKPGDNPERVEGCFDTYIGEEGTGPSAGAEGERFSIEVWQRYASPVWMDIKAGDTLQKESAREDEDERHICPLQLGVIERGIELWSNPGDVVFDPFTGIGSTGYQALKQGRKFIGCELKLSYFNQAVGNLKAAEITQEDLFSAINQETSEADTDTVSR